MKGRKTKQVGQALSYEKCRSINLKRWHIERAETRTEKRMLALGTGVCAAANPLLGIPTSHTAVLGMESWFCF